MSHQVLVTFDQHQLFKPYVMSEVRIELRHTKTVMRLEPRRDMNASRLSQMCLETSRDEIDACLETPSLLGDIGTCV